MEDTTVRALEITGILEAIQLLMGYVFDWTHDDLGWGIELSCEFVDEEGVAITGWESRDEDPGFEKIVARVMEHAVSMYERETRVSE